MKGLGLALALGLFLSTGIGPALAQSEFYGYAPTMYGSAPAEWYINGSGMEVIQQSAYVAPLAATSCAAPVAVTQCSAPLAVAEPVAVVADTCAAPVAVAAPTCATPVAVAAPVCTTSGCDNPNLHGINGSLQVNPLVSFRGNEVIVQPTATFIGGNTGAVITPIIYQRY